MRVIFVAFVFTLAVVLPQPVFSDVAPQVSSTREAPPGTDQLPIWTTPEEAASAGDYRIPMDGAPPGEQVRCPSEFEAREGALFTWDFGGWEDIYLSMVDAVQDVGTCFIVTTSENSVRNAILNAGLTLDNVEFINEYTNTVWIRDYGPWTVQKEDTSFGITDFTYNRPRPYDDAFPQELAALWGLPCYTTSLRHAGGNFSVDGMGTCFASSLVDDENSQGYGEIATIFEQYTGNDAFHMLERTNVEYTGHIDMYFKLLTPDTILLGEYDDPGGNDYAIIESNRELLAGLTGPYGRPYNIIRIPMPDVYGWFDVVRSYTNSLIVNDVVLLPVYNIDMDDVAIRIYEEVLPGYTIHPIPCADIIQSGGAIHCITMGVPDMNLVTLLHEPYLDLAPAPGGDYTVTAEVRATQPNQLASVTAYWAESPGGPFTAASMDPAGDDTFTGQLPERTDGTAIYYYIEAVDTGGNGSRHPFAAPDQIHEFTAGQRILLTLDLRDSFIHPGETLHADVALESFSVEAEDVAGYANLYFENGSPYAGNPVAGPYSFTMAPGASISTTISHQLPAVMPTQLFYYEVVLERPGGVARCSVTKHFLVD